jgi:tetratricopeptide (TPR) repeat protein
VTESTVWLETVVIPEFASWLDESQRSRSRVGVEFIQYEEVDLVEEGPALVSLMHLNGINVRCLLLLMCHVQSEGNRATILTEAVARILKHRICEEWRGIQSASSVEYARSAAQWLNVVFGEGEACAAFWGAPLHTALSKYFLLPPSGAVPWIGGTDVDLRSLLGPARMAALMHRTLQQCGIELTPAVLSERRTAFEADDVIKIVPRVKHLSRISFEEALCCSRMAECAQERQEAIRLYTKAVKCYQECLSSKPDDYRASFNLSLVLSKLARVSSSHDARVRYTEAFEQCRRALRLCEEDWRCAFHYGTSLMEAAHLNVAEYSSTERAKLLRSAKQQLEQSVAQCAGQRFEPLYNLGNALLHLSRLSDEEEGVALLHAAVHSFSEALECNPNNSHALSNLATAQSKVARLSKSSSERDRWFQSALRSYGAAAAAPNGMTAQIYFDW